MNRPTIKMDKGIRQLHAEWAEWSEKYIKLARAAREHLSDHKMDSSFWCSDLGDAVEEVFGDE